MTYKLELFLILQRKRLINIKSFKNYVFFLFVIFYFFLFLWFTYIRLLVFYTKLTHLVQKLKNLD